MKINSIEELEIWQDARVLFKQIIEFTNRDNFNKDFRLRDQIKAASGSIMDNVSEGFGRGGNKEFINFLLIAKGSNEETRSQLYRALDNKYITDEELKFALDTTDKISRKISNLVSYLKQSDFKGKNRSR